MIGHYLMFNRNCIEALKTYQEAFNATLTELQKYGDMPPNPDFPIAEEDRDLVLHARLQLDGMEIMCADSTERSAKGENMYISITTQDAEIVKKAWDILKQDGKVYMELTPSFFAAYHGSLQDKYGVNWMFTALK